MTRMYTHPSYNTWIIVYYRSIIVLKYGITRECTSCVYYIHLYVHICRYSVKVYRSNLCVEPKLMTEYIYVYIYIYNTQQHLIGQLPLLLTFPLGSFHICCVVFRGLYPCSQEWHSSCTPECDATGTCVSTKFEDLAFHLPVTLRALLNSLLWEALYK